MSIEIRINLGDDAGPGDLDQKMRVLGFKREAPQLDVQMKWVSPENKAAAEAADPELHNKMDAKTDPVQQTVVEPTTAVVATRKRGEPSPGKSRRTKAEIAEDEAAGPAITASSGDVFADLNVERPDAAISTGEARVGPEDDEATAAQDAADEAAEAAAKREPGTLTHDDLRHALGAYQKKHGMAEAVKAVQPGGLIGRPVIEVPEADLEAVIAKLNGEAVSEVSKDVEVTSDTTDKPAKTFTKDDVKALMIEYVTKYGKQAGDEDGPKINELALGKIPEGKTAANGQPATKWVWSVLPDDQDSIANLVKYWKAAINQAGGAHGRKAVS